ncbi:Abi family protein [Pelagicoccus sp. SDUM812002]|uniref:Abi family protein n=1 Tax=Pelagicoccus sp. SDUM812002 TaxID=3041266 RepID=UPI00280FAF9A|nr:Abi family protein [Pelagicoccus sp. SDUM812002]MDQ8184087.1 Abi family protein [Pelagicoccus sp. SDUM812002]
MKVSYQKKWLPISEQIEKLESHGLVVSDKPEAEKFLRHLNYYRFSGYSLAFETFRHRFVPGTTFEQIRQAYEFDRALRDLVYESMEVIELDVRTTVAYSFGKAYQAFGHTDPSNFFRTFKHANWLAKLREESDRSRERFIDHFKQRYSEYPDLPIWVATEIMSFGALSRMIEGMGRDDQKYIAHRYGMQPQTFASCLHHLVYVRNICAHHARLWDRSWAIEPSLPHGKKWEPPLLPGSDRLFASLLIQYTLLNRCAAEKPFAADWKQRVETLINNQLPTCPQPLEQMGLTPNWNEHPVWTR